jgi:hypothetical protein
MSVKVEPTSHQDEELHAELLQAFRAYFEANQDWVNKQTARSAIRLRQRLSDIRDICSKRRIAVREWAVNKEAQLAERKEKRKSSE